MVDAGCIMEMADEKRDSGSSSKGNPVMGEAQKSEKLLEQSESFQRSVERMCLKYGMEFKNAFGNDFCNKIGSPFFRAVYRQGSENPYDFAVRLFESLLAYATEIDPAEVLKSVLESFIPSEDGSLMEQEDFSKVALMIPGYVRVVVPLWLLSERTGFNLYVVGMELVQILTPFNSPRFDPLDISFRFLEEIVNSERCCDREKLELIRFIPAALSRVIEMGNSVGRSLNIISALARKDYAFASRCFGSFEAFVKKLNPYALALKALASNGTVDNISKFFSILERRMRRIVIGQEEFLSFASSLFEALMNVRGDMAKRLFRAGELIEFSVIPSDPVLESVGNEDDQLFSEQFGYYEKQSASELFDFLTDIVVKKGGREVPIYMYRAIASLLIDFG
jgi:hypothetical protein